MQLFVGREYPDVVIEAVENAKHSIKILMYDWRWYSHQPGARIQKLNQAIIRATRRGVSVRAVLNNGMILALLRQNGIDARIMNTARTMHIKLVIVDDALILLGSHNFSINAFELNHEMSVRSDDALVAARCVDFFNDIWVS